MKSIIYLIPLLLYFPPIIPNQETQPLLMVAFVIWTLFRTKIHRPRSATLFFSISLILAILVQTLVTGDISSAAPLLQMLVGPLILFGAIAARPETPSRRTLAIITISLTGIALLELFAPFVYGQVAHSILIRANVYDGHRGISLLTPEPTYAAISLIYLILLSLRSRTIYANNYLWIEWVLFFLLVMTFSTYIALFASVVAFVLWPRKLLLGIVVLFLFFVSIEFVSFDHEDSVRVVVAMSRLFAVDYFDLMVSINTLDPSLATRIIPVIASLVTPVISFVGFGMGCKSMGKIFDALSYDFVFQNEVLGPALLDGCLKPPSYLSAMGLGFGSVSVLLIILLVTLFLWAFQQRSYSIWLPSFAIGILLLIVQSQITNPIPWLLVYLAFVHKGSLSVQRNADTKQFLEAKPNI
jgi:hypothetical protein